jgi:hypothetical protein
MKPSLHKLTGRTKLLALLLMVFSSVAWTAEWRTSVVDPSVAGSFSSLRIDSFGNGHVAYVDETQNQLKYGFWDHKLDKWFVTVLDSSTGFCSLTLDSKQRPHISYGEYGTGKIKYARWDGLAWKKETIQIDAKNISFYTSIILDPKDQPRISYYEYWGTGYDYSLLLRTVTWNGKFWEVQTIDSTPGSGKFNFMLSDSKGYPAVAYANVKAEHQGLRFAHWDGRAWQINVLEGITGPYAIFSVALALDKEDRPHIAYTDMVKNLVKYATFRDGKWDLELVDALAEGAYPDRHGIAVNEDGVPYISYYDAGLGVLKLAHREGSKWEQEIVDQNHAGFTSSLQIAAGQIFVTYRDETRQQVRFARRALTKPAQQTEGTQARK